MSMQTALITGASRGLGLALSRALAGRGWGLVITARGAEALKAAREELAKRTDVIAVPGDVTRAEHRLKLAQAANEAGGLDAVINNAGMLGPSPQPGLLDYPLDILEDVYRANVIAPLGVLQAVQQALKPGARVINVTSDAAREAYEGWGGYGSSKAAIEQLSKVLSVQSVRTGGSTGWIRAICERRCTRTRFLARISAIVPYRRRVSPVFLNLLEGNYDSGRYQARESFTSVTSRS